MSLRKQLIVLVTAFAALAAYFVGTLPAHAVGAASSSAYAADFDANALVIRHSPLSDRAYLTVCASWGATTCVKSGGSLARGQYSNSTLGLSDADGFYLNANHNATVSGGPFVSKRVTATGWHKLYGCGGCTRTVDLWLE